MKPSELAKEIRKAAEEFRLGSVNRTFVDFEEVAAALESAAEVEEERDRLRNLIDGNDWADRRELVSARLELTAVERERDELKTLLRWMRETFHVDDWNLLPDCPEKRRIEQLMEGK